MLRNVGDRSKKHDHATVFKVEESKKIGEEFVNFFNWNNEEVVEFTSTSECFEISTSLQDYVLFPYDQGIVVV